MKTHQLTLNDTFKKDFQLIALSTDERDYRLAFLLNQHLDLLLQRSAPIIDKKNKSQFDVYEYKDKVFHRDWFLINNHGVKEMPSNQLQGIFGDTSLLLEQKTIFIKELKKNPFLLRIVSNDTRLFFDELLKKLEKMAQIYKAESVDLKRLKNQKVLMF